MQILLTSAARNGIPRSLQALAYFGNARFQSVDANF